MNASSVAHATPNAAGVLADRLVSSPSGTGGVGRPPAAVADVLAPHTEAVRQAHRRAEALTPPPRWAQRLRTGLLVAQWLALGTVAAVAVVGLAAVGPWTASLAAHNLWLGLLVVGGGGLLLLHAAYRLVHAWLALRLEAAAAANRDTVVAIGALGAAARLQHEQQRLHEAGVAGGLHAPALPR